jgi:hypothetical protein
MYVRFVGDRIDQSSGRREGIFHLAGTLRDSDLLTGVDSERLAALRTWFDQNLKEPTRFARARRHHPKSVAISWFKAGAREHINRIREVQSILESYGFSVEMIKTGRPGYVVYEDDDQVTAYPFNDTAT